MSLEGIANFLYKRKFMWIDAWGLDGVHGIQIPENLVGLFEAIKLDNLQSFVEDDSWDGNGCLGPYGGEECGFAVFVHLSYLVLYP
jgi:hypothetical protein